MRGGVGATHGMSNNWHYRAFSYDVTAAILVFQNKGMAAILVNQAIPPGIKLYFYAKNLLF